MRINTKAEFYRLAMAGKCGNTPNMWSSLVEYWPYRHRYPVVGLRRMVSAHKVLTPGIPFRELPLWLEDNHVDEGTYIVTEVPDVRQDRMWTLQGDLGFSWETGELCLYYTHTGGYMRRALELDGHSVFGNGALRLLKGHMTPSDYDDIMDLFAEYTHDGEHPVIEFSVLKCCSAGGIQARNTLIWEIRHY